MSRRTTVGSKLASRSSGQQSRRATAGGFLIAEFSSLRQEQFNRTLYQQLMVSVEFTAALSIGAVAFSNSDKTGLGSPLVLLLLPPLSLALGVGYYVQHRSILMVGEFIQHKTRPAAQELGTSDVFEWEPYIRRCRRSRLWRFSLRLTAPLFFCLPAFAALGFSAEQALSAGSWSTVAVWCCEVAAVIGLSLLLLTGDWVERRFVAREHDNGH
jgi:hypothetical protein